MPPRYCSFPSHRQLFLYLGFITTAKRIWDLTGNKKNSLWYTLGYYVGCAIPFVNFIVGLAGLVFLGFIPGKDVEATEE